MKRMLFAGALMLAAGGQAFAADLPPPAAPPPPRAPATYVPTTVPTYNWSGFYLGVNGGYGFGDSNWTAPGGTVGEFKTDGFLIGGTVGANFQASALVFGVEGDIDYSTVKGTSANSYCSTVGTGSTATATSTCQSQETWLSTARARVGFAADRVLIFATGGGAFGNIQAGFNPPGTYDSSTKFGWTAGGGVEVAFAQNWTAKVEYLYVDLENGSCTTANCGVTASAPIAVKWTESLVRGGINFKF